MGVTNARELCAYAMEDALQLPLLLRRGLGRCSSTSTCRSVMETTRREIRKSSAPDCSISSPTSKTEVAVVGCAGYVCYGTMLSSTKDPVDTTKVITISQKLHMHGHRISVLIYIVHQSDK